MGKRPGREAAQDKLLDAGMAREAGLARRVILVRLLNREEVMVTGICRCLETRLFKHMRQFFLTLNMFCTSRPAGPLEAPKTTTSPPVARLLKK